MFYKLIDIFERKGLLDNQQNILAEVVMNRDSVKPHEVKMYVKRETQGMYIYTFESRTGVFHWTLMSRDHEEVKQGASEWYAEVGGDPIGSCDGMTKNETVLELVARTMCAFEKGMIPMLGHAVLDKGSRVDLLRYLSRNMTRYQNLCKVFSK